jgi:hypothetical protein
VTVLDEDITATSLGGLPIRKAAQERPTLNVLIYGAYGAGKTLLAGTADDVPDMRKVLFLDIEGGTFTLQHRFPNTDVVRITDWDQLGPIYDEFKAGVHPVYNTVVIDSLTEAQVMNMDKVMEQLVLRNPDRNPDVPDRREWMINQKQVVKMIRFFRDLPVTTIFTALLREKQDDNGKTMLQPELPGQLGARAPALFDEVFYLYVRNVKLSEEEEKPQDHRLMLTGQTEKVRAKDRSGRLPKVMVDPTMTTIYNTMMGRDK